MFEIDVLNVSKYCRRDILIVSYGVFGLLHNISNSFEVFVQFRGFRCKCVMKIPDCKFLVGNSLKGSCDYARLKFVPSMF